LLITFLAVDRLIESFLLFVSFIDKKQTFEWRHFLRQKNKTLFFVVLQEYETSIEFKSKRVFLVLSSFVIELSSSWISTSHISSTTFTTRKLISFFFSIIFRTNELSIEMKARVCVGFFDHIHLLVRTQTRQVLGCLLLDHIFALVDMEIGRHARLVHWRHLLAQNETPKVSKNPIRL
jgi:hypothetical protein